MASSQALRWSPGWEHGAENNHKRGHSLESGLSLKSKDDDLLLFSEMQNHERDNFLLHTADDFDESLSKLRHFSNLKLGINIPTRGEASDLLNLEGDKNDYDWLLTPPDTPLFSSLDDEHTQPVNLACRSRARSQPIMASRSVAEKSYQTTRTSSSPHRLSPSPRSSGTLAQMRGRATITPRSTPPPVIRSVTPIRRPSTPPNKHLAPTSSSSNPTLQRSSTNSSIQSSNSGGRGFSPTNARRGNSASPKLQGWQLSLPGFASEAPPNLRTSLSDRPVSQTRGSSPVSRNGSESSGRLGRKSMSPTSSRSISSSHSHERDRFSSYSKCSLVSSSDDYEESLGSIIVGVSRSVIPRKGGALGSNKAMSSSRKPSKNSPTNCIPKRSFDSALRLMDQRKTPQNMFRPLLSSVPAATFRPIFSRNSSLTTSSNASSDQGVVSVALDVEVGGLEPTELPVGWEKAEDSETHEEVFLFDKVDDIIKDTSHGVSPREPQGRHEIFGEIFLKKFGSDFVQNPIVHSGIETSSTTFESVHFTDISCDFDSHTVMEVCSKCGKKYVILHVSEIINMCQGCVEEDRICTERINLSYCPSTKAIASQMETAAVASGKGQLDSEVSESHVGNAKVMLHERNMSLGPDSFNQSESVISNQHLDRKSVVDISGNSIVSTQQLANQVVNSSLKVDIPEGTGISVLLMQRSSSSKWPIIQGKAVSATNLICSEPSYLRDNMNALRRSIGQDNPSAPSLVDLGSSRQTETSIQQQLCRENEAEKIRNDVDSSVQSMRFPDLSIGSRCPKSESEDTGASAKYLGYNSLREGILVTDDHVNTTDQINPIPSSSSSPIIYEHYISEHKETHGSGLEGQQILDYQGNDDLPCSSAPEIMCNEDCFSSIHADKHMQDEHDAQNVEGETDMSDYSDTGDDYFQNVNFYEATNNSSILTMELQPGSCELEDCQNESVPSHCLANPQQDNENSLSKSSAPDINFSNSEQFTAVQEHGNHEESYMTVDLPGGHMPRNLTLEEATDTILFCSSIIHDLAYKAATIGTEKESNSLPEPPPPTRTFLAEPIPGLRDSAKMPFKHTPRSQMFKRKRIESQTRSPTKESENNGVSADEFPAPSDEIAGKVEAVKPPKTESKCNCSVM